MRKIHKTHLLLLALLVVSLGAMRALFHPGFYTSHDGWHQVARLYHFDQLIRAGQIPPRYSFELLHGYGYPLFTFSYQLPWVFAEPLVLLGVSIFDAIKVIFIAGFVLSGITMFLWQRKLWGEVGGFVASFLYLFAPYRFSNILVRASLGEATSFLFLPLIFYGLSELNDGRIRKGVMIGSIGFAGVLLSHAMLVYLLIVPLAVFLLYYLWRSPIKLKAVAGFIGMFSLGILLTLYYILPAFVYTKFTIFNSIKQSSFQQQFLPVQELLYSPWGYAASFTGLGQMSLQLGLAQWAGVISATGVTIWLMMKRKMMKNGHQALPILISFGLCLYLVLTVAKPAWQISGRYVSVDFPWRFLAILTLLSASLAGFAVSHTRGPYQKGLTILLLMLALYANRNHLRVNQYTDIPLSLYIASEQTTNTFDEYLPRWANREQVSHEQRVPVETQQNAQISEFYQAAEGIKFTHSAPESSDVRINSIYFPGMTLTVDGLAHQFVYKDNGFINFQLAEGVHQVRLFMTEPVLNQTANMGSFVGALILGRLYFLSKRKSPTSKVGAKI